MTVNPTTRVCYLYNRNEIIKFVVFKIDYYKGFYRDVVSLTYFNKREGQKWVKTNLRFKYRAHIKRLDEYTDNIRSNSKLVDKYGIRDPYENIPIVHVNTIWEMYKEIGYDYKKQKYVERQQC